MQIYAGGFTLQFKTLIAVAGAVAALGAATTASAAFINTPIPTNAYITIGGLDWAWGSPVVGDDGQLTFQATLGWRLPTDAELLTAPRNTAFQFVGANVPFNGTAAGSGATFQDLTATYTGAAACATPYFSATYHHCDWGDGAVGVPWAGQPDSEVNSDQLYVRATLASPTSGAVPEPSTWAMLIMGFGALGVMMRRRRAIA